MATPRIDMLQNASASQDARRPEVKRAGDLVARWRDLAEQRLEHLIELYHSGRWQKYYNEADFLKQIREVVAAVEAWKQLVPSKQVNDGLRGATLNVWKDIGGGDTSLAPDWQSGAPDASHAPLAPGALPRDHGMQTEAPSILPGGSNAADVLRHLANTASRPKS